MLSSHVQALIQESPFASPEERALLCQLGFEIECGRVIKPVQSYKSAHSADFLLWRVLRFLSPDPLPIPYINFSHLLYNIEKEPPNWSLYFLPCPIFFLTCTVRMIYIKYLSEHFISLLTTQQWLPIILKIDSIFEVHDI